MRDVELAAGEIESDADPDDEQDSDEPALEVLEENWPTVQVYMASQWNVKEITVSMPGAGSYTKLQYLGIASTEVLSSCVMLRIPRSAWPRIRHGTRIMVAAAAKLLNAPRG